MKTFRALLKNQLHILAINPVTWISAVLFTIASSFLFFRTARFFTIDVCYIQLVSFFSCIPYISILILPALMLATWPAVSEMELTLPVSTLQIVLSKWFAALAAFSAMLILTLHIPFFSSAYTDISFSACTASYTGLVLFASSLLAFCQFIFVCSHNRIFSFVITALTIAVFNTMHLLPVHSSMPDSVAALCKALSFSWHFDSASKGIYDSRDILFYIHTTVIWLTLCVYKKNIDQYGIPLASIFSRHDLNKHRRLFQQTKLCALILCAVFLSALNSNSLYVAIDATPDKQYSVSDESKHILADLNDICRITYYRSEKLSQLYPQTAALTDFLQSYVQAFPGKNAALRIINPDNDVRYQKQLANAGISGQQIQTAGNGQTTFTSVYSAIEIEYAGKSEIIPFLLDSEHIEYLLSSRILSLLGKKPAVQLLIPEQPENDFAAGYQYVKPFLETAGFDVIYATAGNLDTAQPLVIFGDTVDTAAIVQETEQFVMNGGNLFASMSPYKTDLTGSWNISVSEQNTPLLQLFDFWGISFGKELIADKKSYRLALQNGSQNNEITYVQYPFWLVADKLNIPEKDFPVTKSFSGIEMYWPVPIHLYDQPDASYIRMIDSSNRAVLIPPSNNAEILFNTNPFSQKEHSGVSGNFTVAAAVQGSVPGFYTAGKSAPTKMIFLADNYTMSDTIEFSNSLHNLAFFENCLLWLGDNEQLLAIKNRSHQNTAPYKLSSDHGQYMAVARMWTATCFVIIPLVLLFCMVCMIWRPQRRTR